MDNGQTTTVPLNLTNSAYVELMALASYYGIPLENVGEIIIKGIKVLDAVKNAKTDEIILEVGGQRQVINVRAI